MFFISICDDNNEFRQYLIRMIKETYFNREVFFYEFETGEKLIEMIKSKEIRCDLLILEVQLPDMDGNETALLFRKSFPEALLIFCSGECKPTDESFKVRAFRYLYKSYSDNKMSLELKEIMDELHRNKSINEPVITCNYRYETIKLSLNEILYIGVSKRGCEINMTSNCKYFDKNKKFKNKKKLQEIYEELKEYGFEFAHSSYIVNMKYIKRLTPNSLSFIKIGAEDEIKLDVSRSKSKYLRDRYTYMLASKYGEEV